MTLALTVGVLVAGAAYLLLQRELLRVVLGFVLLSHAVNLMLFSAGGAQRRGEPLGTATDPRVTADPLPQAFVLTAIVIAFAITIYLLVLAVTGARAEAEGEGDEGVGHDDGDDTPVTGAPATDGPTDRPAPADDPVAPAAPAASADRLPTGTGRGTP